MRPRGRKLRCAAPGPSRICTRLTHTLRPRCRVGAWNGAAMGTATALIAVPQQPSPDPNIHGDKAVDSRPRGGKAVKGADKLPGKAPTLCVCVCVCARVHARDLGERGGGPHPPQPVTLHSPMWCMACAFNSCFPLSGKPPFHRRETKALQGACLCRRSGQDRTETRPPQNRLRPAEDDEHGLHGRRSRIGGPPLASLVVETGHAICPSDGCGSTVC
mmetsp:Transcript_4938/g.12014  ORF Transcript_4938/g.12014 Transcript_4938/m.12014 type:complete len:217 (-) Transcript_4938:1889-2539(-)